MQIALAKNAELPSFPIVSFDGESWHRANDLIPESDWDDIIDILEYGKSNAGNMEEAAASKEGFSWDVFSSESAALPFQPKAYRDFMLYESHCINASRGFVKKYMPRVMPVIFIYEKIFNRPFPKLKPRKRWYKYPIYYLGNHLNFVTHQDPVSIPAYTRELDYELELGAVISSPLKNATPKEAEAAIGGFVVFNDFSARDVQIEEVGSGFGPMKTKNFANAISNIIVSADKILPQIDSLSASIYINNNKIVDTSTAGMHYSLHHAIAYASWEEQLYPGEFFGSGTLPGGCGMENGRLLQSGDTIRLEIECIGALENHVI